MVLKKAVKKYFQRGKEDIRCPFCIQLDFGTVQLRTRANLHLHQKHRLTWNLQSSFTYRSKSGQRQIWTVTSGPNLWYMLPLTKVSAIDVWHRPQKNPVCTYFLYTTSAIHRSGPSVKIIITRPTLQCDNSRWSRDQNLGQHRATKLWHHNPCLALVNVWKQL